MLKFFVLPYICFAALAGATAGHSNECRVIGNRRFPKERIMARMYRKRSRENSREKAIICDGQTDPNSRFACCILLITRQLHHLCRAISLSSSAWMTNPSPSHAICRKLGLQHTWQSSTYDSGFRQTHPPQSHSTLTTCALEARRKRHCTQSVEIRS